MAIAGLERFKPNVERPEEFLRFWALTVAELQRVDPDPQLEEDEVEAADLALKRVRYRSLGDAEIHGYLLCPKTVQPRPLVVHAHGYNDRYEIMVDWAQRGFNVFGFDARGFGRSTRSVDVSEHGYVITGVESPRTSILRGAVADYLQAVRVARELLPDQVTSIGYYGFSFGGGLALMAAALSRDPNLVVVGQPTFGWNEERFRLALAGSALHIKEYVDQFPWRRDTVNSTLDFFDTLHFAPLIQAPVFLGIGLDDDVVPSRTLLALANYLKTPVEVRILPVSHSADPRESLWQSFKEEWLRCLADGLPSEFGTGTRQLRALARSDSG